MADRRTAYEVGLYRSGELVDRLAFTERKTRRVLLEIMQRHGPRILSMLQRPDDDAPMTYKAGRWHVGEGLSVAFTGRTERDCANGEGR